jgi:hypothetical protein
VRLGPGIGRFVVVEGLAPGDELVVRGHRALVQGEAVETTRSEACCDAQLRELRGDAAPPAADTAPSL